VTEQNLAQSPLPDSLRESFSGQARDSTYVNKLNNAATDFLRKDPAVTRIIGNHAREVAAEINYTRGHARTLTVLGNSYWYEGIYEIAQSYYLLAARQYQLINDSTGLGETYNNIGEVYKKLNELNQSLDYLLKSQELIKKDSARRALILYNIGELYFRLKNSVKAKEFTDKSYAIAITINNQRIIAFNYWNYAAIELSQNHFKPALAFYFDAEKIWKATGETRALIQTYQDIAEVYRTQRNFFESEKYLKKAITLAGKVNVPDLQVTNYLRYALLDSMRGNYGSAFYYLSRHNALKDSVYSMQKAEQIARFQTIYETESHAQENQILRNEKQIRESELASQKITLLAISVSLFIMGLLASILYRQQRKILFQKNAIEVQATVLLKLNEDLQLFNKTLETRIKERTSQLTVQNQRLTEFTFINAHQLRAPVARILGLINLLNQPNLQERDEVLGHLKTCGEELDAIIHEVSRSLEGAIVKEPEQPGT
jgi:tetratricopeptide (TPR) repeat protein